MKLDKTEKLVLISAASLAALLLILCFVQPYFEAKTFNKYSSKKATYWDAFFAELRGQAK